MGVIDERYIPSRQRTEEAEIDAWLGVTPLPRLQIAPPEDSAEGPQNATASEPKSDMSLTMTPKGPAQPAPSPYGTDFPNIMADTLKSLGTEAASYVPQAVIDTVKEFFSGNPSATFQEAIKASGIDEKYIPKDLGLVEAMMSGIHGTNVPKGTGNADSIAQKAIRKFGVTTNTQDALFLLDDGTFLSKANGPRPFNHDDISSVMTTTKKSAGERIEEFSQQTGAARITDEGEGTLSIQAFGPLTEAQITRILRAGADHRMVVVDIPGGSGRFDTATERSQLRAFLTGIEGPPQPATPAASAVRDAAAQSPGKFNAARQMASEEVTDLTAAINVKAREMGMMQEQTRGKQSWTETDLKANELVKSGKMSLDRILALRPGDVFNAEEGLAARNIRDTAATVFKDLLNLADTGDESAKAGLEAAAKLASRIETNIEAASGTEIARALAIRRKASLAYDSEDVFARLTQRTINPEVLYQFYKHLTSNTEREAFTKYLETTSWLGRWVNAFLEARAAGLLTIRSIERNLIGSGASTIWSIAVRPLTAAIGTLRGTADGAYAHEALDMMHGIYHAQSEALAMAGRALKTGEAQFLAGSTQTEQGFLPKISSEALNLGKMQDLPGVGHDKLWQASPTGHFFDVMGEIIRWTFRGLTAGDDYFKFVNYEAQKYALAYRQFRKLISEGATEAQAAKEYSALITQPPEWLSQAADEHSLYTTFNDEIINPAGKAIMGLRDNDGPVGQIARFILPFAKTPMNVMGYGAEVTPLLNFLSSHYWQEIQAGGVRKDAAYARLGLGSTVLGVFAIAAANGYLNGKGPKDTNLRKLYEANGWKPYSINLPGINPIPFLGFSPLSEVLGQAADFGEMVNQGADDITLGRLAGAMVLSTANVMEEYPMLKGLADIHEAINTRSQRSEGVIQETLKSMLPLPGLQGAARTISSITDPYQRETRSPQGGPRLPGTLGVLDREVSALWEEFAAVTPWLQNYQYPKRDILGRPLIRDGGWWALAPNAPSAQEPHPVLGEIKKHWISVGLPAKAFSSGKQTMGVMDDESMDVAAVTLSPAEWARYQELSGTVKLAGGFPSPMGRTLTEELTRLIASQSYQKEADGPAGGKASEIKATFREYRDYAKDVLLKELRQNGQPGDLERLVAEKQLLQDFKRLTKAQQAEQRPGLEQKLGRPINIGILK